MPTIIRGEYLSYYNPLRNSDKLFNVFLILGDDNTYSCLTENGRRGSSLVCRTICENVRRETAESKFWEKVREKQNHRDTPYTNESTGSNYSQIASQYQLNSRSNNSLKTYGSKTFEAKTNVIEFPDRQPQPPKQKPGGILNSDQFDSLEL
jgi:hypothetical protein